MYICSVLRVKQIITLILVVFITASASSIALFEHICKKEGVSTSLFVPVTDHESHESHEHAPIEDVCCHSKKEGDFIDKDCCDTDVKILKVDHQYYSEIQKSTVLYFEKNHSYLFTSSLLLIAKNKGKQFYRPPPKPKLTKRLALLQTYLI